LRPRRFAGDRCGTRCGSPPPACPRRPPALFLKNYDQVLLADAYGGYEGICVEKAMIQAGCWSHARRKFVDAQSLSPAIAVEALALIGRLFAIEQHGREMSPADRLKPRRLKHISQGHRSARGLICTQNYF
jgi:hypothetical protein